MNREEAEQFCDERRNPSGGLTVDQWQDKTSGETRWSVSYWVWTSKANKVRIMTKPTGSFEGAAEEAIKREASVRRTYQLPEDRWHKSEAERSND